MNAASLYPGFRSDILEESLRGEDYVLFKEIISDLKSEQTLAIHPDFSWRFYYIAKEPNTKIIPLTWQTDVRPLLEDKGNIVSRLLSAGFKYVLVPTLKEWNKDSSEYEYIKEIDQRSKVVKENSIFRIYQLDIKKMEKAE
ncbi:hypothetical protein LPTSP4_03370 [Leptospira ryugenii]|uniref:Uncharacterized protein n=2 Tax=Leptospira ryugenii TaxID=1917863 RepID=A0A2P2DW52_9LEPT|nr:hypothetical protein LPTSP4_03370 [Leptospira ryugenii]